MSILDEREATTSLKLIIFFVSLLTFGAFGGMYAYSAMHPGEPVQQEMPAAPAETGVL